MAADWGLELEVVAMGFDSLLDAAKAGKVDSVVSAMPYDPRATRDYAYSSSYFDAGVALVVRAGSPIQGVEDLAGKAVAVEWGSMGDMVGRRLQRADATVALQPFPSPAEALQALIDDPGVDALLVDRVTLREAQGRGAALVEVGPVLESNPYVIAMPLHAATLHERVEETLQRFRQEGVLAELEETWFRSTE
jgi:ABC-type amino acid transport substrate-binding protein